jgi:hypothetical protein
MTLRAESSDTDLPFHWKEQTGLECDPTRENEKV